MVSTTSMVSTSIEAGGSSTTTTAPVLDDSFPEIELVDPDPSARLTFDANTFFLLRPPVFDLSSLAGVHSHRSEATIELGAEGSLRTWSETAGLTTHVRVDSVPLVEGNPTEWIITPAGVWALMAGEWVYHDPNEGESAFVVALAPWQLTSPLAVYARVYHVFSDLEPQRWETFDGRAVVVYTGGADAVARFWEEEPGAVATGHVEVWMDPEGFPRKLVAEADEIVDLSIPPRLEWLLRDVGAAIEFEIPDQVASAGTSTIFDHSADGVPVLAVALLRPCPAEEQTGGACYKLALVYEDGRWKIDGTDQEPMSGELAPSEVDSLLKALETADFVELRTLLFKNQCPTATGGEETVLVFPTVTGPESFASCTLVLDAGRSPYREAFELIEQLPID
jgi:hypothetical protein